MGSAIEQVAFYKLEQDPELFFEILPFDWSVEISPVWPLYATNSSIYVLKYAERIIGGGILFSMLSPDVSDYGTTGQLKLGSWFEKGYGYVAYFFISDDYRGIGLGKKWLRHLIEVCPFKGLFLTIDDKSLIDFYEKAGFGLHDEIVFKDHKEWLLVRKINE